MQVLHVAQPTTAGVPVVVRSLVREQVAAGLQVAVACPADGDLSGWVQEAGASWCRWEAGRSPGPSVPGETVRLARLLREQAPDLVHLHSAKAGLAGRLALRGRLPTVFQPHAWSFEAVTGVTARAAARWERAAGRWTDLLVCVSDDERRRGLREGIDLPTLVNPNGVDLQALQPTTPAQRSQARLDLGLPDAPLVVCVGRLARQKGQDVLVAALPALRQVVPGVRLVLVGDGPDREGLAALAPDALFSGNVDDVAPWLRAADVVALPSRWEAGVPLVALEAMALGRPVVVSAVAGTGELGPAATVVAPDDPAALASALARILREPGLAADMSRHGRRRAEQHHDRKGTADRALTAYGDVVAGRRTR